MISFSKIQQKFLETFLFHISRKSPSTEFNSSIFVTHLGQKSGENVTPKMIV